MRFEKNQPNIKANQISSQIRCKEPNLILIKSYLQLPMNNDLISNEILKIFPNIRNKYA